MLKRLKRGFTLAELLIVVAIIAVLTAIAVPLFVNALDNAEKEVGEANIRAVRGAAVVEILSDQETYMTKTYKTTKNTDGTLTYGQTADDANEYAWYVTATIDGSGDITKLEIWDKVQSAPAITPGTEDSKYEKDGDTYKVQLLLTEDKLTVGKAGGA